MLKNIDLPERIKTDDKTFILAAWQHWANFWDNVISRRNLSKV